MFRSSYTLLALALCISLPITDAQTKREIEALRANEHFRIDGILNEGAWIHAFIADSFTNSQPVPNTPTSAATKARILYDDVGIYVAAEITEPDMKGLGNELLERDNLDSRRKIDWFAVFFDPYNNGLQGFGFLITASGVQADLRYTTDGEDGEWDAVWECQVAKNDTGWTCEFFIPYNALRFPKDAIQTWGINFGRNSYQRQEKSWWSPLNPQIDGFINQWGTLRGIRDVKAPTRLSLTPFLAVYAENYTDRENSFSEWSSLYNGGMDVKYGISDAFTLDMTLIPDFGQTQSDNQILNLSPFEVQFNENRQFFTEGLELFSKANVFYSRRVGGSAYYLGEALTSVGDSETIERIRPETRLINATKISGRNRKGAGFGFFNAISPRDQAIIKDQITGETREVRLQPWTNYNVVVWDQNLKNNSYFSLINTSVMREGSARDANVSGTEFEFRDKSNTYSIFGSGAISQRWMENGNDNGFTYNISIGKQSGNLNWSIGHSLTDDAYDNNDLGFQQRNNRKSYAADISYTIYEPIGPFLNTGVGFNANYFGLYKFPGSPEIKVRNNLYNNAGFEFWWYGQTKSFWNLNTWFFVQPAEGYDYFEPRVEGRFFRYPALKNFGVSINSDNRKRFTYGFNGNMTPFHERHKLNWFAFAFGRYRINNHFAIGYEIEKNRMRLDRGGIDIVGDDIIMGARTLNDLSQIVGLKYIFNSTTTLDFRLRHNWTRVHYTNFYRLLQDGGIEEIEYNVNQDLNFNAWNIDMQFRWRFAPGSDIYVVWKNSIYGLDRLSDSTFGENIARLWRQPQTNSLSVKAIYFLDVPKVLSGLNRNS